ncbi:protein kinase [Streptomyces sp. M19]
MGCLAHGGNGWVYLGTQEALDQRPVAIKGLINPYGGRAMREVVAERSSLTALTHPNIVRIIGYETQPHRDSDDLAGYLVMDFVPGMSLDEIQKDWIARRRARSTAPGPRTRPRLRGADPERAGVHARRAAAVLRHEAAQRGAPQGPDQRDRPGRGAAHRRPDLAGDHHPGYTAPEVGELGAAGLSERSDLYSVGRTLLKLSAGAGQPPGLAAESYRRLIERATARDPRERFGSAREMAEQARGVLREVRSLRTSREVPSRRCCSRRPCGCWTPRSARPAAGALARRARARVLAHGLPAPHEVPGRCRSRSRRPATGRGLLRTRPPVNCGAS